MKQKKLTPYKQLVLDAGWKPALPALDAGWKPALPALDAGWKPALPALGAGWKPALPGTLKHASKRELRTTTLAEYC